MSMRVLAIIVVVALASGCTGGMPPATREPANPPATTPPAPTTGPAGEGVDGLIAALGGADAGVREADRFAADPLGGKGVIVCAGEEPINVYVFDTPAEAEAHAAMIDRRDPSNVGTAIIEWAGEPKFWLHGRLLVLYLGTDAEVEDVLLEALGEPFAFGRGRPPLRADVC